MNLKSWNLRQILNLAKHITKPTDHKQPTQRCYGCGTPVRAGFTFCDACFYKSGGSTK